MNQKFTLKKIFLSILLIFTICVSVFSLPGYKENLPTESGEYVFYRDFTFAQETYLGFLYYDEGTIGVRYFSKGKSDIQILFSLDTSKDFIELTGERIISQITPEDVEIVNYIHDMIYEFSTRRKKIQSEFDLLKNNSSSVTKQIVSTQDFQQFGGQVQLVFDGTIPVFNLESISDFSGKMLLQAVTMGTLVDSADTSFEFFVGFENLPQEKEEVKKKKLSKKEKKALDAKIQKYNSLWKIEDSMPGEFKTLGDYALFWEFPLDIVRDTSTNEDSKQVFDYFARNNRLSSNKTYTYLPKSSVSLLKDEKGNTIQISKMIVYDSEAKEKYSVNYKILVENNGIYRMIHFSAYESWFKDNQDYIENMLKSIY